MRGKLSTAIIVFIFFICNYDLSFAQVENLNIELGEFLFKTSFDTTAYTTTLKIFKGEKEIYKKVSDDKITGISEYDLNNDGKQEILIDRYTGGAHCCNILMTGEISDESFNILDSIYWGNSYYSIRDLNNDGRKEILGANDMFAYAFTNFAQSEFNVLIYEFKNDKFTDVTGSFPKIIEEDIDTHIEELRSYMKDENFKCPENDTTDTFNTDAGAVKAILAPIVADYYNLGDIEKGYTFVDLIYKCPDKDKFIRTLQNDYKLK